MDWFENLPWSKRSSAQSAKVLLGAFLGRNPDPMNLAYYGALIRKWASPTKLLREVAQNQEYKSFFGARRASGPQDRPCVWSGEAHGAYTGETTIDDIVVVKLDHIGDFILALEAFSVLRQAFPAAQITLLCAPWNAPLARSLGIFQHVETLDFFAPSADASRPGFSSERLGEIAQARFDLAIDLRVDADTRVVLDHLRATHKCGYASNACRSVLTVCLPRPNMLHSDSLALHQRMLMLSLAHAAIDFFRQDEGLRGGALREKLRGAGGVDLAFRQGRPLVAIHPFSGRAIKNWPLENFMRLASWLTVDMGAAVVLLGTKREAESTPGLAEMAKAAGAKSLVGETALQEAIALIAQADLFVGNDSGLTHVAARLDVPTLAIFSGTAPIEVWAPFGRQATILHAPVDCAPCYLPSLELCPNAHKCVALIDFDSVRSQAERKLRENRAGR